MESLSTCELVNACVHAMPVHFLWCLAATIALAYYRGYLAYSGRASANRSGRNSADRSRMGSLDQHQLPLHVFAGACWHVLLHACAWLLIFSGRLAPGSGSARSLPPVWACLCHKSTNARVWGHGRPARCTLSLASWVPHGPLLLPHVLAPAAWSLGRASSAPAASLFLCWPRNGL